REVARGGLEEETALPGQRAAGHVLVEEVREPLADGIAVGEMPELQPAEPGELLLVPLETLLAEQRRQHRLAILIELEGGARRSRHHADAGAQRGRELFQRPAEIRPLG